WPHALPRYKPATSARDFRTSTAAPTAAAAAATAANYSNDSQDALVRSLVAQALVRSPRVEAAMRAMDRRDFTSTHMGIPLHVSYSDAQVAIGQGATISAPSLHAVCLELLEAHAAPGAAVLDVGAGSGYLSGCLSLLVGDKGHVVALERQERLLDQAGWSLARALAIHFTSYASHRARPNPAAGPPGQPPASGASGPRCVQLHNIELLHGNCLDDAVLAAAGGPFDAIHVGAAAREVPAQLLALLRPGGRMVLPLGPPAGMQSLTVVDKAADGAVTVLAVR
ncbi:Protein-L-isoaspartate O-methyltransferase, partial [Tetrabaena socialis]